MNQGRPRSWLLPAALAGVLYALVGITFAIPASHVRAWRLAAWGVSGVAWAIHLLYENFRLRSGARRAASHAAIAVALGALGLAVSALVHSVASGRPPEHQRLLLLALVLWPMLAGVPAFLAGLAGSLVLERRRRVR